MTVKTNSKLSKDRNKFEETKNLLKT